MVMKRKEIKLTEIQSPCKVCEESDVPACRQDCYRLNEFLLWLDHNSVLTFGVCDPTDESGYNVLR